MRCLPALPRPAQRVTDTYTAVRMLVTSDPSDFLDDDAAPSTSTPTPLSASTGASGAAPSAGLARAGSIGRPLGRASIRSAAAAGGGSGSAGKGGGSSRKRREAAEKDGSMDGGSMGGSGKSLGALLSPEALAAAEQLPQLLMFMANMRCEKLPVAREDDCVKIYMVGVQARVEAGVKVRRDSLDACCQLACLLAWYCIRWTCAPPLPSRFKLEECMAVQRGALHMHARVHGAAAPDSRCMLSAPAEAMP